MGTEALLHPVSELLNTVDILYPLRLFLYLPAYLISHRCIFQYIKVFQKR